MGRGTVQGSHCLKWRRKARLLHRRPSPSLISAYLLNARSCHIPQETASATKVTTVSSTPHMLFLTFGRWIIRSISVLQCCLSCRFPQLAWLTPYHSSQGRPPPPKGHSGSSGVPSIPSCPRVSGHTAVTVPLTVHQAVSKLSAETMSM